MGWKASQEHKSEGKTSRIGSTHFDVYRTNQAGSRNQSHRDDLKVSGSPRTPSMRDVHPPSSKK